MGSLLEPIRLHSAAEHIAGRLMTAIALGEFVAGQRLPPERDLAAMLGVSRATVREAIQRLAALGNLEVRRGRNGGAFVLAEAGPEGVELIRKTLLPQWDHFERLFDFRQLMEPLIASVAAQRRTDRDTTAIEGALDAYRNAGRDREASRAADQALHAAIARATHNPYLVNLSASIRSEISLGFGAEPYSPHIRRRAIREHTTLAQAVIEGDAKRAARLSAEHFAITETVLRELHTRIERDAATAHDAGVPS
jgi:GntR family transcriptional regulator, transcriptional repressor for pyruvate dehydrogenase complex